MKTFEFLIPRRPVSCQTRRRARLQEWKDYVQAEARKVWTDTHQPPTGPAAIFLVYLYEESALDTDNIVKPIQDALVGLALSDDSIISDVVVRRRQLTTSFCLDNISPTLASGFDTGGEFVYVRLEDAPSQDQLI